MTTNPDRAIGVWLLFVAFLVYIMIGIGGYTRLSNSGLSMVKWKPVTGWLPPLSETAWEEEFKDYQTSPEFKKINYNMDLDGFKKIYYPEYIHRVFGRIIGIAFFIPFFIFVLSKKLVGSKMKNYLVIGLLGGVQGGIGWFMVKSGLDENPHVSAYRLALHLCLAGFIFWLCFLNGLKDLFTKKEKLNPLFYTLLLLIALQICSGAFVSGQHAGSAFKAAITFNPNVLWVPELGWKNLTENLAMVMCLHLSLGVCIFILSFIQIVWFYFKTAIKWPLVIYLLALFAQVTLGLTIAAHYNPKPIALSLIHQLLAFLVLCILSSTALFCHRSEKTPLSPS